MFDPILVPLDSSERAESALPVAMQIARATGGSLFLVQVVPFLAHVASFLKEPSVLSQEVPDAQHQASSAYLARQKQVSEGKGIAIHTSLLVGMPAQQLLSFIETEAIDLVVMGRRNETGLRSWIRGSVARSLLRHSPVPVLILRESAEQLSKQYPLWAHARPRSGST